MDLATESFLLSLLVAYVLPLVGAFISSRHWSGEVLGIVTTVLAVITAFVQELIQNPHAYSWSGAGLHALIIWVVAFIGRNQTWKSSTEKPNGITAKALAFPAKLPPAQPVVNPPAAA